MAALKFDMKRSSMSDSLQCQPAALLRISSPSITDTCSRLMPDADKNAVLKPIKSHEKARNQIAVHTECRQQCWQYAPLRPSLSKHWDLQGTSELLLAGASRHMAAQVPSAVLIKP